MAKRKSQKAALIVEPPQLPTPELQEKGEFKAEFISAKPGSPMRVRRTDTDEITRLMFAKLITPEAHTTLARFQKDLRDAGMVFSVRASLEPSSTLGHAQFIADASFRRVKRIGAQMEALTGKLGEPTTRLVLAVLTQDWRLSKDGAPLMESAAQVLDGVYGRNTSSSAMT